MEENESEPKKPKRTPSRGDALFVIVMMAGAATAIAGFGLLFSMWWQTGITDKYEILRIASQEYINGNPILAADLAETVELEDPKPAEEEPEPGRLENAPPLTPAEEAALVVKAEWMRLQDFLIGAGRVARAAEAENQRARRRLYYEAIPYLKDAREAGFPLGREAQGNRLLGESLFNVGQFDEAAQAFRAAIQEDPVLKRDLLPKLARAQLDSMQPTTTDSLATINLFLTDVTLTDSQRRAGELIRIRALIDLDRWQEADDAIRRALQANRANGTSLADELDAEFRDQVRLQKGIMQVLRAREQFGAGPETLYDDRSASVRFLKPTMQAFASLQREAAPKTAARARLWAARAYLIQGRQEEALTELEAVKQQRPFGAEGVVGALEAIELLADQGRGKDVFLTTKHVMQELGDARGFDATLIPFSEFRRRLRMAIDQLRRMGKYEHAIDAARILPPVFERSEALMQEGQGFREWAATTITDGTDISGEVAVSAASLARSRYRAAGDAFAEAAKIQFNTPLYVATLWSAIESYQQGRHFSRSIELLESYLRYERPNRLPRGLVAHGRALLAVGQAEDAIETLVNCIIEFPRDPLRYDARLLAARAHAERGELDDAKRLLTDNLNDGQLGPQSPAWRNSLLTLGELLYRHGYENHLAAERVAMPERLERMRENQPILEEAIRRLDEAVTRYWPTQRAEAAPRVETALYLSSRTHVLAAQWPRIEAESPEILDAAKRALRLQSENQLQAALEGFSRLREHLALREEEHRLPGNEQAMLRNCFLAEADTLREMNDRLEEAAEAYRAVSLRFMNEPPALEAILGQVRCAKELGRDREADLLIRQAGVILQRIPNEWNGRFEETTRFDRDGWERLLTWMNNRLDNTTAGT